MKLFVYGSLQHPLVWQKLLNKDCSQQQAVLLGWKAVKVKNEDYPALIPANGAEVSGIIQTGLSEADFEILDAFEGEQYQRNQLTVTDIQGQVQGQAHQAYVYLFKADYQAQLSIESWSYQEFVQHGLSRFLNCYLGWQQALIDG